jgi:serine protease SohB
MEFLSQYGLFLAKSLTLLIVILLAVAGVMALTRKPQVKIKIKSMNEQFDAMQAELLEVIKQEKPEKQSKQKKKEKSQQPTLFVLDFVGDIKASAADALRKTVSAVLLVAKAKDEVVIRVESPGGSVNGYGLCASQLQRIRDKGIHLTVCIDKVAASGGYLMACVANHIVAAPFAIIGSIGVVAQLPNFHRFLKQHHVDVELYTSGEFKRTVTLFGENSEKGRKKFQEELDHVHDAFKHYVLKNRPQLDIEKVATGEHWLAMEAFDHRLVDAIKTSDDYLTAKRAKFNIYEVSSPEKLSMMHKLMKPVMQLIQNSHFYG